MSGFLRIAVVLVVAAAAALAANLVLLGVATSGDPVGHLSPRGGPAAKRCMTSTLRCRRAPLTCG